MRIPRNFSGQTVARVLVRELQYSIVHQRGSTIVLETEKPAHQRIVIPDHKILRIGTLNAIVKAVAAHKQMAKDEVIGLF